MQEDRLAKRIFQWSPIGKRRGRPALAWETYIKKAMEDRDYKQGTGVLKAFGRSKLVMGRTEKEVLF
jgi:hypothetical protein